MSKDEKLRERWLACVDRLRKLDYRATLTEVLEDGPQEGIDYESLGRESVPHKPGCLYSQAYGTACTCGADESVQPSPERCAVCGFPLAETREKGCRPGDCSMRPLPQRAYEPARANREYRQFWGNVAFNPWDEGATQPEAGEARQEPTECLQCGAPVEADKCSVQPWHIVDEYIDQQTGLVWTKRDGILSSKSAAAPSAEPLTAREFRKMWKPIRSDSDIGRIMEEFAEAFAAKERERAATWKKECGDLADEVSDLMMQLSNRANEVAKLTAERDALLKLIRTLLSYARPIPVALERQVRDVLKEDSTKDVPKNSQDQPSSNQIQVLEREVSICELNHSRWIQCETAAIKQLLAERDALSKRLGKPRCLDCNAAGITNCSHFDNCAGKWKYELEERAEAERDAARDKALDEASALVDKMGRNNPQPNGGQVIGAGLVSAAIRALKSKEQTPQKGGAN